MPRKAPIAIGKTLPDPVAEIRALIISPSGNTLDIVVSTLDEMNHEVGAVKKELEAFRAETR